MRGHVRILCWMEVLDRCVLTFYIHVTYCTSTEQHPPPTIVDAVEYTLCKAREKSIDCSGLNPCCEDATELCVGIWFRMRHRSAKSTEGGNEVFDGLETVMNLSLQESQWTELFVCWQDVMGLGYVGYVCMWVGPLISHAYGSEMKFENDLRRVIFRYRNCVPLCVLWWGIWVIPQLPESFPVTRVPLGGKRRSTGWTWLSSPLSASGGDGGLTTKTPPSQNRFHLYR